MDSTTEHVVFRAKADNVPYIRTKPLHHSQREIETDEDGSVTFSIDVILNKELEQKILSHGDKITILSPDILVENIKNTLFSAKNNYYSNTAH